MALDISKTLNVGGIYPNISIFKSKNPAFGNYSGEDTFECSSYNRYVSENAIQRMITTNPKIAFILQNLPTKLNMTELNTLLENHAKNTQNTAQGIIENLPLSLRSWIDEKAVSKAAYLHDIGKVLIPSEILNKTGKLDAAETEIMHKHAELGYELLKTTDIDEKTLNLIRNHHQNSKRSGYPFVNKDFKADLNLQILAAADKYSALTEKRVYKKSLTPKEALTILSRDVQEEKLNPDIFKALVNYIRNTAEIQKFSTELNTTLQKG